MTRGLVVSGLVGSLLACSTLGAAAQDRQNAASDCSGFMCKIFGTKLEDRAAVAAAPPSTAAQAVAAIPDPADPSDAGAPSRKTTRPTAKALQKPAPVVTIAADAAEASRLKALAATMPKSHVHIVARGAARTVDFTAAPALAERAAGEKARLFTEQLHVVAGPSIRSITDLNGKVVSFGPDKGPSQVAARRAFAALGVNVTEVPLEVDNALDGLATGDVAALVVLAPQPDPRLAALKRAANLHLVSWPETASLPKGLDAASIAAASYPGLATAGDSIRAVGIDVALDGTGRPATPAAKAFLAALAQHSAVLSKRGFDLIRADVADRVGARVASVERR